MRPRSSAPSVASRTSSASWAHPVRRALGRVATFSVFGAWGVLATGSIGAADGPPAVGDAERLVALLVADTDDPEIGESVATDLRQVRVALELCVPSARLAVTERTGADAAPARLLATVAALDVGPADALLLYYAGHGAWADAGAYLRPKGQVLPRADLIAALRARGAGLTIVLTDCCSTYVGGTFLFAPPRVDPDTARDLFFRHRGLVDVTAAARGQVAVGDKALGGVFTQALTRLLTGSARETLDADRDGIVTWGEAVDALRVGTRDTFAMLHPRGLAVRGQAVQGQTPHVFGDLALPAAGRIPSSPRRLGLTTETAPDGARVVAVVPGTPAAWMGVRVGERVVEIRVLAADGGDDARPVGTPADLVAALQAAGPAGLVVVVLRDPTAKPPAEAVREVFVRLGP